MKWIASILVYSAVGLGLFLFRNAWTALLIFHLAILISLIIARPNLPVKTLITSNNIKWILMNILLCGSSGVILYFLWDRFGIAQDVSSYAEAVGLNQSHWIPFIAYFTLVNPWVEEYFWRGYLGSTSSNFSISDFVYAGFHGLVLLNKVQAEMILYSLVVLALAGWFWRQIFRADRGLLAPVLGHMAADFSILMAIYSSLRS